jgi:hypothetical protein
MAVAGGVIVEVGGFFLEIAFHAAADGRVKLGEVADFHAAPERRVRVALTYSKFAR